MFRGVRSRRGIFSQALSLVLFVVLLEACSAWNKKPAPPPPPPPPPEARYFDTDLEELVRYGEELVSMTDESRRAECAQVLNLMTPDERLGVRLHLLQIQMLDEGCGNRRQTLDALMAARASVTDEPLRNWIIFQERLLTLNQSLREENRKLDKHLKQAREKAAISRKRAKSMEGETRELQDKLDALKSIEQNLGGAEEDRP
jgi:hypothetical protein